MDDSQLDTGHAQQERKASDTIDQPCMEDYQAVPNITKVLLCYDTGPVLVPASRFWHRWIELSLFIGDDCGSASVSPRSCDQSAPPETPFCWIAFDGCPPLADWVFRFSSHRSTEYGVQ